MATITVDAFNDAAARTAGEAITISSGARYTQRTDNRVHANAPAAFAGSYSSLAYADIGGEYFIDATTVREVNFNSGTGNVPAVGTVITNNGASGYLLGVWASRAVAPTAVGAAMPTSGFIKFREITGGSFAAGALTGIGASATGADTSSWIEITYDASSNLVVPRVGKLKSRGQWYELGTTNGTIGQQIQCPSTSIATNNYAPGVWVETAPGSNIYEAWEGLNGATNGWARTHLGHAKGFTDKRTKFVKSLAGGLIQFGEDATLAATYASLAAQASTYAAFTVAGTYTWANNKVTINTGATAHLLEVGMQVGLDFTSGSGVDAIFTITELIDAYNFECDYTGSGTGGNVTCRIGVTVTFTAHALNIGEQVYCDFTSGTGVDGTYTIFSVDSANAYKLSIPTTSAITSGNVSTLHTLTVTYTAHGHAIGNKVYCEFTSGGATNGEYVIKAVATNTFNINFPHAAVITTSNVNLKWTIGYVPEAGCKVRIPNIIISECATGARATNTVPNATIASRPELTTTNAGAIDLEMIFAYSFYTGAVSQAFSLRLKDCAFQDNLLISEISTAINIDNILIGQYSAPATVCFLLSTCYAGGTINNVVAERGGANATNMHPFQIANCFNQTVNNIRAGNIQFVRSSGYGLISYSQNITINDICLINASMINVSGNVNITINNYDYNDRYIGNTNATATGYFLSIGVANDKITLNGVTVGLKGTLPNCHPFTSFFNNTSSTNIKFRNIGTKASPINTGSWAPNAYACGAINTNGGTNINVKYQKIYGTKFRLAPIALINSDKNITYEDIFYAPFIYGVKAANTSPIASLNTLIKASCFTTIPTVGQVSVYGTHMMDYFTGNRFGEICIQMNEPTAETASFVTIVSGNVKFNSAGGVEMRSVGDQCIWEMPYFAQGHTAFKNNASWPPTMSGGTIGNYTLEYQIDTGSGWNGTWKTLNLTNLSTETINPAIGFKQKIRITTAIANSTAITSLRWFTDTTSAAQEAISYPLDTAIISINSVVPGSRVRVTRTDNDDVLFNEYVAGTSINLTSEYTGNVKIEIRKGDSVAPYTPWYTITTVGNGVSVTALQVSEL